ncbi:MAG TPA: fimbrillin family protein [Candidatus Parabacteroides intestinipullorum]|uniref:Fimbrillin family protein n=1 Tax=Candidatus Parabacteroides intestinipullorum TaxID=2838723 RepID=A0A9D2BFM4_9BACT|nr:fimbrillin family protein [Candidatus Parabacteroides intestinipullorum]
MRQTIMLMAACAALQAGCTNEVGEGLGIDTPIQVTANVEGIMTTRAENTKDNLDNFGLFIKDKDGGYDTNYGGENIKVSKPEGESVWTLANEVLYQGSGQTYFAYAPHADAEDIDENMILSFSVQADQSTGTNMQASDLLYDQGGTVGSANLSVTFSHKLSKLTVTLQKGENLTENVTFDGVTLRGTKPTTTLNLTDGAVNTAPGTATDIKMCPTGTAGTYECILVPQEATYSVLIYATVGGEQKTYVYTPSAAYKFESDRSYTLALKVKKADEPTAIEGIDVKGWDESIALGDGEAVEPYTIEADGSYTVRTAEGLQAWADAVGESSTRYPINCTLDADIDMTGQSWTPIRTGNAPEYTGVFDGNGHTITGLGDCLLVQNNNTVRNLTLVNPTGLTITTFFSATGAVAGENWAFIENCHVVGGNVKGANSGGIAGINMGGIRACSSSATVNADRVGGIVGHNEGSVLACYATGSVTGIENGEYNSIGAIVGWHVNDYGGTITACYWSGDTEKGVGNGNGSADGTTKVGDGNWRTAMSAMNTALTNEGISYRWTENNGEDKESRPLIIATE